MSEKPITANEPIFRALVELARQISAALLVLNRLSAIESIRSCGQTNNHQSQCLNALENITDYSLVLHLAKALAMLRATQKLGRLRENGIGRRLRLMAEDIKVLRNKREHLEDHLDPRTLAKWIVEEPFEGFALRTLPDWSSTINGVRKLGGRVAISDIEPALRELRHQMMEADLWLPPWSPEDLIAADATLARASTLPVGLAPQCNR